MYIKQYQNKYINDQKQFLFRTSQQQIFISLHLLLQIPSVPVNAEYLKKLVGCPEYNDQQMSDLIMNFGQELDEICEEEGQKIYKIDVGANRQDLLCAENIAKALRIFLQKQRPEQITLLPQKVEVKVYDSVKQIRPFFVSAIVHNVTFDQQSYKSFIDHQDKLHFNLCRKRSLVAIGTHDLDKINSKLITYTAEKPEDIVFTALKQDHDTNANELFEILQHDKKLSEYIPLINKSPVYPVLRDADHKVLSLPPIINSEYSKIEVSTHSIFIDITATDKFRAYNALSALLVQLSMHSSTPNEVEPVKIIYEDGTTEVTPFVQPRIIIVPKKQIYQILGFNIPEEQVISLLEKQQHTLIENTSKYLKVAVPQNRFDILASIDIIQDIVNSYGVENVEPKPILSYTTGHILPINRTINLIRHECANCGYTEVHSFCLTNEQDAIFVPQTIQLQNAKSNQFTTLRSSLLPGLVKCAAFNASYALPIKLFECSEVYSEKEQGMIIKVAGLYGGVTDGFEVVQGLADRIGIRLNCKQLQLKEIKGNEQKYGGFIANRIFGLYNGDKRMGIIGVLSLETLQQYGVKYPCSVIELDVE